MPGKTKQEKKIETIIAKLTKQQQYIERMKADLREIAVTGRPISRHPRSFSAVAAFEREIIEAAIKETRGNQEQAARMLGIGRDRLRYKLIKYKLL
jgi:DNA-binding NtrC family response regulator